MSKTSPYLKAFFILLCIFLFTTCKKEKDTDTSSQKATAWFNEPQNFKKNKDLYRTKFLAAYKGYLKNKAYNEAKLLLYSYSTVSYNTQEYDSLNYVTIEQFLNKNYALEKDTTYAYLHYIQGWRYSYKNDYKKAIQMTNECLIINQLRSKLIYLKANKLIGYCYYNTGQPERAIKTFTDLLPLAEQLNDLKALGSLNYNTAYCYDMLHAYNESEKMYKKAANYFLAAKDTTTYYAQQCFIAKTNFDHKNDTLGTLKFIDTIIDQFQEYKQPTAIDFVGINNLKAYKSFLTQQYDSAFYFNNKNIEFYKNEKFYLLEYQLFDYRIYFEKYKKLKDKKKLLILLDEFLASEDHYSCIEMYHILYENALAENNTKEAIFYRDEEIALNDKLLEGNQKGQLFEFDKKYQSEKKEKEIAQQKAEISFNKLIIIGLALALATFLFGIVLFNARKRKKEAQAETARQEQFTFQLLQNTEEERSRIANELHDSVNHDLLNIKNNLINGKTIEASDVAVVIEEVRNISRNLHPAVLVTIGLEASIESLCEKLSEIGLFTTCEIDYTEKFSKSKELQLYRIIQEALNNTLKHGKANAAKVILTSQSDGLQLEIKDNGNGFDVAKELHNPKSFGLQSIIQRAKAIAAKIKIDSTNKGTIILLNIPL